MAYPKVLAFLLCEQATQDADGKVTLHGVFDRIMVPRTPSKEKLFFVYYKIVIDQPCTVRLRVTDSEGHEIEGNWRDSLTRIGPMQAVWALTSSLFKRPGPYVLELKQESNQSEEEELATMVFVVDERGE